MPVKGGGQGSSAVTVTDYTRAPCRKPPSQKDVQEALDGYSFSYKWDRKSHYVLDIILSF